MIYHVAFMQGYRSIVKCLFYSQVSPDSDNVWNRKAGLQLNELFDFHLTFVLLSILERNEIYLELSANLHLLCGYLHNCQK